MSSLELILTGHINRPFVMSLRAIQYSLDWVVVRHSPSVNIQLNFNTVLHVLFYFLLFLQGVNLQHHTWPGIGTTSLSLMSSIFTNETMKMTQ